MNYFFIFLIFVNLVLIVYLYYLFYKKIISVPVQKLAPVDLSSKSIKIQLQRYNPFSNVGGDQSFTLCLLDNQNSGVIITSLHTPHLTRIYAKNIKDGQSDGVSLSKEEKAILAKTVKNS
ncbi:MAG: DUF4446 family protein [Candidatus Shapirobacteria bacterium]